MTTKWFKSPFNCVILPLTQPKVANQQKIIIKSNINLIFIFLRMYQINDSTQSVQITIIQLDLLHVIGNNIKKLTDIAQNSTNLVAGLFK